MPTNPFRLPALVTTGVVAAIALTACSSSGGGAGTSTKASSAPKAASSQPAASGNSVTADLTEFKIALSSKSLKAGTYTIHVSNGGQITHALTVDGPGVKDKSTGDMSPGATKDLTVTLKAGSYEIYCPVGDHKMEGMDEKVQVA